MALSVGDAIDHPTFGIGIVTELREGNKAQIAFKMAVGSWSTPELSFPWPG